VRGEFALRGEVLDIFMAGEQTACRIVFDFDVIEKIRAFDPETQNTVGDLDGLTIYPMKEVIWTENLVGRLEEYLNKEYNREGHEGSEVEPKAGSAGIEKLLDELLTQGESEGEELFYPVLFPKTSVLDYLSPTVTLCFADYDRLRNAEDNIKREYEGLYQREKPHHPVPKPEDILIPFAELEERHEKRLLFRSLASSREGDIPRWTVELDPPRSFFGNITYLKETFESLIADGWRIVVFAESENQALRISEMLKEYTSVAVVPESITAGFGIPEIKMLLIQENEIFGRRKRTPKTIKSVKSAAIDTFVELNPDDYVVHVNYGIGRFKGIERVKALGNERDYIKVEYADEETVFIPIEQVNLVQRYIGNEGDAPRLDRLGSKSWENRKNKVRSSVEDIAKKLIDLYSRRQASRGFPFHKDSEWQTTFEAEFPWEETDDQLTVAAEVKADMEKPAPMDRLICGDVGYGKTEIAFRAAFKAVMSGKQVAFLAPTTLLAEQHYETCVERFAHFPVHIAQLSRMVPKREQHETLKKITSGEADIVIGTHRIIQKDIHFKDLGLLVVDEEQRFGVKDKERLKELKANIDCLAMSATPIPRTLHMSLLKIRDMSLLATPPHNRQAIETVVDAYSDERVVEAIRAEAERGGQVFYLHNRVESLDETRVRLERLLPEILVGTAHGQMATDELDDVFRRFKMGGYHVLVATTIIENGIDIPNVNTIIIDRADMFGVSQLYQLRGRVGRSDRKAYAYLLYPENRALSEIAMKRLQVISDFTELGSGFKIAMKDMEIRGAGNLLGRDQSGDVYSVGFDLYLRLLEEAVQRLSDENYEAEAEVLMELEYTGFIPDAYIANPQIKMEVYKKIASISEREEIALVYNELIDRFGPVPEEVSSLLALAEIRVLCKGLSISTIKERNGFAQVEFGKVANISIEKVLRLIAESGGKVKLDSRHPNYLLIETGKIGLAEKSVYLREKLEKLSV
jgi:transcription-repair coupling factor (superfamily II helicase)